MLSLLKLNRSKQGMKQMSHEIDMSNGQANIAFIGSRNNIWHRMGQEMQEGQSIEEWVKASGLGFEVIEVPAYAHLEDGRHIKVDGFKHMVRNDTMQPLGYATDMFKPVQPIEAFEWFEQYISVDERFKLDTAGSLRDGKTIWVNAKFNGDLTIGGDRHVAHLLMTTAYDGTMSTINKATMTRTVCKNTLNAALAGKGGQVKTSHRTKFNAKAVSRELGEIVQSIEAFKKMGDAMAETHMSKETVSLFFKKLLDIPFDVKADDIGTRKLNIWGDMKQAYKDTLAEGTPGETKWCALNAVTRYVDHMRTVRDTGNGEGEARLLSSQFGSGSLMKEKAVRLLTIEDEFKALCAATPMVKNEDVLDILKQPFRV